MAATTLKIACIQLACGKDKKVSDAVTIVVNHLMMTL